MNYLQTVPFFCSIALHLSTRCLTFLHAQGVGRLAMAPWRGREHFPATARPLHRGGASFERKRERGEALTDSVPALSPGKDNILPLGSPSPPRFGVQT